MRAMLGLCVALVGGMTVVGTMRAAENVPATWPQWRGPTRDGMVGGPSWPSSLKGDALKPLWRLELGDGYSSPIVSADKVFVTETIDKKTEQVRALERKTGKELWRVSWPGAMSVPFFARRNGSWIRSTPAYDGDNLYVAGMRDVLVCLDANSGKERWRVDFTQRYKTPLPDFGFVCSPLVVGDALYVQAGASFLKLNKKTGETIWRSLNDGGGMMGSAFSSPVLVTLKKKEQLLVQTRQKLTGVDPDDGKVLWSQAIPAFRGMNILTPTLYNDQVFTSAYGDKTYLFDVSLTEKEPTVKPVWSAKIEGYMSTPVIIGKHAYLHLRNKRFTCINLETGQECWKTRPYGEYWSLVAQKDRILALDQQGILYLIKANPEKFELLDERKISDAETWAHLAICGEELFIRELKAIAAYRWTETGK